MTDNPPKPDNIINFPKKFTPPPKKPDASRRKTKGEIESANKYHDEIFEYEDGSYVVLVQPKKEKFSIERMTFMAERLKMTLFDALPCYEYEFPDIDLELVPDPEKPV